MLRAYEFFILLGKYKRDVLTPGEFEKFAHAIRTVRKYRHAFYESTGDRKPNPDRSYKTGKTRESQSSQDPASRDSHATGSTPSHARHRKSPRNHPSKHTSKKVWLQKSGRSGSTTQVHQTQRPSRQPHRWVHLSASMLKEYRRALAIAALGLVAFTFAIWWFATRDAMSTTTPGIHSAPPQGATLEKPERWSKFSPTSVIEGFNASEADQLLAIASGISDSSPWKVPAPVQTSIEQAIWDGMDSCFSRPEEVFGTIELPKIPLD